MSAPPRHSAARRPARPVRGFTLIEVMMAMFILALGMTAVASIFPGASLMQRRSYDDILTRQVKDGVVAMLSARGLSHQNLSATADVTSLGGVLNSGGQFGWPLAARCYPAVIDVAPVGQNPDGIPNTGEFEDPQFKNRQFYWVPLYRNKKSGARDNWQVFVFILRKQPGVTYPASGTMANPDDPPEVPKVVKLTASGSVGSDTISNVDHQNTIYPGDMILGSNGQVFQVQELQPTNSPPKNRKTLKLNGKILGDPINAIWVGAPAGPGATAVTKRIFALGSEAVK